MESSPPPVQPTPSASASDSLDRSILLILAELAANLLLWVVAIALFAPDSTRRRVLALALVAWTLGLRHGLDVDHIVAIDNVTRNLVSMGQLPVTCGLFFSLGHSSIVIGVTIAIIISTSSIERIPSVASVGGLIGVSVSASFLLLLAIINSVILHISLKNRHKERKALAANVQPQVEEIPKTEELDCEGGQEREKKRDVVPGLPATSCIARLAKPLFSFGFDTSSEIALLGVSALARTSSGGAIPTSNIIILPLLFTAGMSLADSLDSVFMLHAYALPKRESGAADDRWWKGLRLFEPREEPVEDQLDEKEERPEMKMMDPNKLLTVQIVLTIVSISIALLIAIIEFMG
ncbi:hypothetical protein RQP46_004470 [Phenoliferia psychrophenolica]